MYQIFNARHYCHTNDGVNDEKFNPSRADVNDVANAVHDRVDGLCLVVKLLLAYPVEVYGYE